MCCIKPLHITSLKRLRYTKFFKSSPRLNWSGGREDDGPKQKHHLSGSDFTIMFVLYPWNMKTPNFVSWTFRKTTLAFPVFNVNITLILIWVDCKINLNISNASHECRLGEKYVVEQHSVEMFDDKDRCTRMIMRKRMIPTYKKLQGLHFDSSRCRRYLKQGSGTPRCPDPVIVIF